MSELVLENENKLPLNWTDANIGSIGKIIHYGFTATSTKKNTGTKYLRITDIQNNHVNWTDVPFCKIHQENKSDFLLHENDIVFARTGGTVGKSFLIKNDVPSAVFASYLIRVILTEHTDPKFIHFFFQSGSYWNQIQKGKTGLKTNVNAQILSKLVFQLPPLNEQKRIVVKIEELFSEIEKVEKILKKSNDRLDSELQLLLHKSFQGDLTEEWRNNNEVISLKNKIEEKESSSKKRIPIKIDSLPQIPLSWVWTRMSIVCTKVTDGTHFSPSNTLEGDFPYVTAKNLKPWGLDLKNITYVSKEVHNELLPRCNAEKNDVLYIKDGVTTGLAVVNDLDFEFTMLSSVALLKPDNGFVKPYYLKHYLNNPLTFNRLTGRMTGVAIKRIILDKIRNAEIPIPPIEEQNEIINIINKNQSLIQNAKETIISEIKKLSHLKFSILKNAFEGKLVPQDPNDESAEILLQKIKLEKEQLKQKEKSKKRKKNV
jgi:type I restriction enzyme, S subunit